MEPTRSFALFTLGLILFIFFLNLFATIYSWYWLYPNLDKLLHFLGGAFIGSAALYIYHFSIYMVPRHGSFIAQLFIAAGALALVGIFWEFFEYILYTQIASGTPASQLYLKYGLADTLGDLLADLLGSVGAAILFATVWNKKPLP